MSVADGGFNVIAIIDGATINGNIRVENMPLAQRYTKGSTNYIPNYETTPTNNQPVVVAIITDITDNSVLIPRNVVFKYNGTPLTFGPDNICDTAGFEGMFQKLTDYSCKVGAATYPMPALRVIKNLVPISGYDNDRLSVSGEVEIGGQALPFTELSTDIKIEETSGSQYVVSITDDNGTVLIKKEDRTTLKADVYRDGVKIVDLQGITFQWVKLLGTGDVNMSAAQTQVVTTADIDNILRLRCDVIQGGKVLSSGFVEVIDRTDPYVVEFEYTGNPTGKVLRKGQSVTVTPKAVKRSNGEVNTAIKNWSWNIKDNKGNPFSLQGKTPTFNAESCLISYADTQKAGMGINGYVSAVE